MDIHQRHIATQEAIFEPVPVRVLIVSDQPVSRIGLKTILNRGKFIQIVGEISSDVQVVEQVNKLRPDVTLFDCYLTFAKEQSIIEKIILSELPTKMMALSPFVDKSQLKAMIAVGLKGCLLKTEDPVYILNSIKEIAKGATILSPELTEMSPSKKSTSPKQRLTTREREVVALLVKGYRNRQIAEALFIEERTVRFHLGKTFKKLGVKNRTQAVMVALDRGFITAK